MTGKRGNTMRFLLLFSLLITAFSVYLWHKRGRVNYRELCSCQFINLYPDKACHFSRDIHFSSLEPSCCFCCCCLFLNRPHWSRLSDPTWQRMMAEWKKEAACAHPPPCLACPSLSAEWQEVGILCSRRGLILQPQCWLSHLLLIGRLTHAVGLHQDVRLALRVERSTFSLKAEPHRTPQGTVSQAPTPSPLPGFSVGFWVASQAGKSMRVQR